MMIKRIIIILCVLVSVLLFSIPVFADTHSLYGNVDDSNGTVNILIDIYNNDFQYDPFNEYVVFRTSQYDYYLYFGKEINGNDLTYYHYVSSYNQQPARISRGNASSLTLNTNGYYYVGNVDGSLSSVQFNNYKTMSIVIVALIIILILFLFRIFRKSHGVKSTFYKV